MSPRHLVLVVMGGLVLLAGVYLFHEVRSTPANAAASSTTPPPADRGKSPDLAPTRTTDSGDHPAPMPRAPSHDPAPAPHPVVSTDPNPSLPSADDTSLDVANPKLDAVMDQANKAYDRSDFEEAKMIAGKVLAKVPTNVRMMRIMVSASCIDGDTTVAQKWFEQLPKPDREQMKVRCDKYGVSFKEPAQ